MRDENISNIGVAQKHRDTSIGFPKTKNVFLETYGWQMDAEKDGNAKYR